MFLFWLGNFGGLVYRYPRAFRRLFISSSSSGVYGVSSSSSSFITSVRTNSMNSCGFLNSPWLSFTLFFISSYRFRGILIVTYSSGILEPSF